jgi:hypothetical protein
MLLPLTLVAWHINQLSDETIVQLWWRFCVRGGE